MFTTEGKEGRWREGGKKEEECSLEGKRPGESRHDDAGRITRVFKNEHPL